MAARSMRAGSFSGFQCPKCPNVPNVPNVLKMRKKQKWDMGLNRLKLNDIPVILGGKWAVLG